VGHAVGAEVRCGPVVAFQRADKHVTGSTGLYVSDQSFSRRSCSSSSLRSDIARVHQSGLLFVLDVNEGHALLDVLALKILDNPVP